MWIRELFAGLLGFASGLAVAGGTGRPAAKAPLPRGGGDSGQP